MAVLKFLRVPKSQEAKYRWIDQACAEGMRQSPACEAAGVTIYAYAAYLARKKRSEKGTAA